MDILFGSRKLEKTCTSGVDAVKVYGPQGARVLRRRLDDIRAASTLAILGKLPQARCHELVGDRKGQLAVDLNHPYRLIFEPANHPLPVNLHGGLDWERVTAITIIEVVDYHG